MSVRLVDRRSNQIDRGSNLSGWIAVPRSSSASASAWSCFRLRPTPSRGRNSVSARPGCAVGPLIRDRTHARFIRTTPIWCSAHSTVSGRAAFTSETSWATCDEPIAAPDGHYLGREASAGSLLRSSHLPSSSTGRMVWDQNRITANSKGEGETTWKTSRRTGT